MPKVSVLMPVYKTNEGYLREAIESILAQSFRDFEFLILEDCPEDDREAVIKSYNDERIRYIKNDKNLGITPSRNKLIDEAKGEYLAVFDHDDISLPTRFEKQVAYLDEHPEVGVVSSQIESYPEGIRTKNLIKDEDIKLSLMTQCALNHPAAMIRKKVLTDNNVRYREECTPAEDYALWCDLMGFTKFYNIDEVLFKWRKHESNTSKLQKSRMSRAAMKIHAEMESKHPALYKEFLLKATQKRQINLFGFIPLIRIETKGYKTKIYLFNLILIASYKLSIKLKGA